MRRVLRAVASATLTGCLLAANARADEERSANADRCPEHCGEVLRLCLEVYRKRHECLALTDACTQACKAGEPVLDTRGEVLSEWHYREGDPRTVIRW